MPYSRTQTGAWIETIQFFEVLFLAKVAPKRVRGLKPDDLAEKLNVAGVAPKRVCGLKPMESPNSLSYLESHPNGCVD